MSSDVVWKAGVEQGVIASRIVNLFVPPPDIAAPESSVPAAPPVAVVDAGPMMAEPVVAPPPAVKPVVAVTVPTRRADPPKKKGHARAVKGAEIVSQDGETAKYCMKCPECGTKDQSYKTIRIENVTTTATYYCPKCKKRREVVVQCRI